MDEQKFREILREEIRSAFRDIGLEDTDARDDIKDLRGLLKTYKSAQSTIIKTIFAFVTLGVLSLISLGTINKISGSE